MKLKTPLMCMNGFLFFFFFNDTATTEIYTLSLHDALPISVREAGGVFLPVRFCGRLFSKQELELIREIARDYAGLGITEIARTVCELLDWTRANGRLKDQECRRLLERLRDQGWLTLTPVRNSGPQGPRRIRLSEASAPQAILEGSAGEFAPLELRVIESRRDRKSVV